MSKECLVIFCLTCPRWHGRTWSHENLVLAGIKLRTDNLVWRSSTIISHMSTTKEEDLTRSVRSSTCVKRKWQNFTGWFYSKTHHSVPRTRSSWNRIWHQQCVDPGERRDCCSVLPLAAEQQQTMVSFLVICVRKWRRKGKVISEITRTENYTSCRKNIQEPYCDRCSIKRTMCFLSINKSWGSFLERLWNRWFCYRVWKQTSYFLNLE